MTAVLRLYEHVLLRNLSAVQSIESGIRNITWFLPGRFEDSEVASEGLTTLLSVISGYHDTLITRRLDPSLSLPPHPFVRSKSASVYEDHPEIPPRTQPILPPISEHNRYTRYWADRSGLYRKASRIITTLNYVQLLVEMLAKRRGERVRWRLVLVMETIKTFLRLVILRLTNRPVLSHPTPYRDLDISSLPTEILDPPTLDPKEIENDKSQSTPHPILPLLPAGSALRTHLYPLSSALPEEYLPHPPSLLPEIKDFRGYAAEVLSCSATLVQVILLLRVAHSNPNHHTHRPLSLPTLSRALPPFLIPLLLRILARHLRTTSSTSLLLSQHNASQDKRLLAHAFLTGPMWIGFTRPKIQSWVEWFEKWPLIGMVAGLGEGYLPLVDDYIYYTSS